MSAIVEATKETFQDLVSDGSVLVDVWGPRCAPCIALMPVVEQIAAERPELRVVKLDATGARRLCMDLRVMGLPTFLLFRDGREVARVSESALTAERLRAWLSEQEILEGKGGA